MEKKVLYNVLKAIALGGRGSSESPDGTYLSSLEAIGMIKTGWDNELTDMGRETLEWLRGSIEKW